MQVKLSRIILLLCLLAALLLKSSHKSYAQGNDDQPTGTPLYELQQSGQIELEVRGKWRDRFAPEQPILVVRATLKGSEPLTGTITVGQILVSRDPAYCNVAALALIGHVELNPSHPSDERDIVGFCLESTQEKQYPTDSIAYDFTPELVAGDTRTVMLNLYQKYTSVNEAYRELGANPASQLAIWAAQSGSKDMESLQTYTGWNNLARYWAEIATYLDTAAIPVEEPTLQNPPSTPANTVAAASSQIVPAAVSSTTNLPNTVTSEAAGNDSVTPVPVEPTNHAAAAKTPNGVAAGGLVANTGLLILIFLIAGIFVIWLFRRTTPQIHLPERALEDAFDSNGLEPRPKRNITATQRDQSAWQKPRVRSSSATPLNRNSGQKQTRQPTRLVKRADATVNESKASSPNSYSYEVDNDPIVGVIGENWRRTPAEPTSMSEYTTGTRTELVRDSAATAKVEEPLIVLRALDNPALRNMEFVVPVSGGLISREPTEFIVIAEGDVSDPHAVLRNERGQFSIKDLHSLNGTRLNNSLLLPGEERALTHRDELAIGKTRFVYDEQRRCLINKVTNDSIPLNLQQGRWVIGRRRLAFVQARAAASTTTTNTHFPQDTTVSIPHAKLELRDGLLLRDLNSLNGTWRAQTRLQPGESQALHDGDEITIGALRFKVTTNVQENSNSKLIGDRYDPVTLIAQGGMANIYEVRDTRAQNVLRALKIPQPAKFKRDDTFGRDFRNALKNELQVSKLLEPHDNIVNIYEQGEDRVRGPFLVMERIAGVSLARILELQQRQGNDERAKLTLSDAAEIVCQVVNGLQHLHKAGWVHCDVKPDNLLIDATGRVKLIDLGSASPIGDTEGPRFSTPPYSPPDYRDGAAIQPNVDAYMLGFTLYEMITGEDLGSQAEFVTVMTAGPAQEVETVLAKVAQIDANIHNLLARALRPRDRHIALDEFTKTLTTYRKDQAIHLLARTYVQKEK